MVLADRLNWEVRFVYREANNIAHKSAKLAFSLSDERVWMDDDPIEMTNDLLKEIYCNDLFVLKFQLRYYI